MVEVAFKGDVTVLPDKVETERLAEIRIFLEYEGRASGVFIRDRSAWPTRRAAFLVGLL